MCNNNCRLVSDGFGRGLLRHLLFCELPYHASRFGFRRNPKLVLIAKPRIGARHVNISRIVDWIERKLCTEFQVSDLTHSSTLARNTVIFTDFVNIQKLGWVLLVAIILFYTVNVYSFAFMQRVLVLPNMEDIVIPLMIDPADSLPTDDSKTALCGSVTAMRPWDASGSYVDYWTVCL